MTSPRTWWSPQPAARRVTSSTTRTHPELDELDALQREAAIEAITLALLPAAEQRRHAAAVASGSVG